MDHGGGVRLIKIEVKVVRWSFSSVDLYCDRCEMQAFSLSFAARLDDYGNIMSLSGPDLERMTQLSAADVSVLKQAVAKAVLMVPSVTGLYHNMNNN